MFGRGGRGLAAPGESVGNFVNPLETPTPRGKLQVDCRCANCLRASDSPTQLPLPPSPPPLPPPLEGGVGTSLSNGLVVPIKTLKFPSDSSRLCASDPVPPSWPTERQGCSNGMPACPVCHRYRLHDPCTESCGVLVSTTKAVSYQKLNWNSPSSSSSSSSTPGTRSSCTSNITGIPTGAGGLCGVPYVPYTPTVGIIWYASSAGQ